MRKNFRIIFFFTVFFILFLFPHNKSYAACSISIKDNITFSPRFKEAITIEGSEGCNFQTSIRYIVFAYPDSQGFRPETGKYWAEFKNPLDEKTFTPTFDLNSGALGMTYPGTWTLKICAGTMPSQCTDNSLILGSTTLTVIAPTPTPTQTPAQNLPIIDLTAQTQCVFQKGTNITINRIKNLAPNRDYAWWWGGDFGVSETIRATEEFMSLTVAGWRNNTVGSRTICIDISGSMRCQSQNSIRVNITAGVPEGDTSCEALALTPTQPPAPPPPCAEGKLTPEGKCTEVDTGLGIPIKTEPADFIKSIFGILLGLSGGIALLLIIASGYRLMASQGNPEKLQGAKEMLTSAIVGLLFIIFSFVILQVIGVDILKIPDFNP